jgi:large subunit ribosomal protein L4
LWAGGGTVHPPRPRDYSEALPKKKRRGAMKLILTDKLKNERLMVFEDLNLESHRTREVVDLLQSLNVEKKVLLVDDKENRNLFLGSRNLRSAKMVPATGVNVFDLLNHDFLMISKQAILDLQEVLKK